MRHPLWLLTGLLLAGTAAAPALASPVPVVDAAVTDLRLDPVSGVLELPLEGLQPPIATIANHGKSLVIDLPRCEFPYAEMYGKIEGSPLVKAFVAAYDPEIRGLHVVIEGHVPLTAEPDLAFRGKGMRFTLTPKDPKLALRLPRPQEVTQKISVVPRDGSPQRSFSVATAHRDWQLPALRLGFTLGPTTEQFAPQGLSGGSEGVGRFSARWEPAYGEYSMPLRLGRGGYVYADPDYAGVEHQRAETVLDLSVARRYALGPVQASSGVGYSTAFTQVQSSAKAVSSTFFFAGYQAIHGPSLRQTFAGPVWGPLGVGLELGWSPYVFAHVDGGTTMPWLTALRVEPRLYLFPDERVSLGYFYERTVGTSFNRESSGVSLGMSFSGF